VPHILVILSSCGQEDSAVKKKLGHVNKDDDDADDSESNDGSSDMETDEDAASDDENDEIDEHEDEDGKCCL